MQKKTTEHSLDSFVHHCRHNHLKVTPQRMAIYKKLIRMRNHPSADTMFREIREEFPSISFDTVNRTLITFSEIGLIDIIEGLANQRRYDPNTHDHHHFHCVQCGVIIDFYDDVLNGLEIPDDIQKRFTVQSTRVVIKGLCGRCREKT